MNVITRLNVMVQLSGEEIEAIIYSLAYACQEEDKAPSTRQREIMGTMLNQFEDTMREVRGEH